MGYIKGFVPLALLAGSSRISRLSRMSRMSRISRISRHLSLITYHLSFISTIAGPMLSTISLAMRLCSPCLVAARSPA